MSCQQLLLHVYQLHKFISILQNKLFILKYYLTIRRLLRARSIFIQVTMLLHFCSLILLSYMYYNFLSVHVSTWTML